MGFPAWRHSPSHPPEISQRTVVPEQTAIAHFIQLGNPHPVFICRDMLGFDVHGDLGEIEIGSDPRRRSDAGGFENIQNDGPGQLPSGHLKGFQITGGVNEHLINGIDMDVLRSRVFEIDLIDPGAPLDVVGHPGRSTM